MKIGAIVEYERNPRISDPAVNAAEGSLLMTHGWHRFGSESDRPRKNNLLSSV